MKVLVIPTIFPLGSLGVKATTVSAVIRRIVRIGLLLGLLGGIAIALTKLLSNQEQDAPTLAPRLTPEPVEPARLWVEPSGSVCPTTHPVKAKLASKIFHLPGMLNYERTNPDRCYRDEQAAEGDGLRAAKR